MAVVTSVPLFIVVNAGNEADDHEQFEERKSAFAQGYGATKSPKAFAATLREDQRLEIRCRIECT